jgi:hypothetical protein
MAGVGRWLASQGWAEHVEIAKAARARGEWWPWRVYLGALWRTAAWCGIVAVGTTVMGAALARVTGNSFGVGDAIGCSACCALPVTALVCFAGAATTLRDRFTAASMCEPHCVWCGYDLSGVAGGAGADALPHVRCSECGKVDPRATLAPTVLRTMRESYQRDQNARWWKGAPRDARVKTLREWRKRHTWHGPDDSTFTVAVASVATGLACLVLTMGALSTGEVWEAWHFAVAFGALVLGTIAGAIVANWATSWREVRNNLGKAGCPACGLGFQPPPNAFGGMACPACHAPELRTGAGVESLLAEVYGGTPETYALQAPPPPIPPQPIGAAGEQG